MSRLACLLLTVLGTSQLGWWIYHLCIAGSLAAVLVVWDRRFAAGKASRHETWVMFSLFIISIALMWLPNYPRPELNPDESQWIAQANNLLADPALWVSHFLVANWSRVLTVLPLSVAGALAGGSIGYEGTRVVAVVMWAGFAVCLFVAAKALLGRRTALWTSAVVAVVIGRLGFSDFVAYNSELPVILLCMAAFALVAKLLCGEAGGASAFAAGALTAMVVFAKDQGIPMAFVLGAGAPVLFVWQGQWKTGMLFVAGGLTCCLVSLSIFVGTGNLAELISMLRVSQDYAQSGTHWRSGEWFHQLRFFRSLLLRSELKPVFILGLASLPLMGIAAVAGWWKPTQRMIQVAAWCVALAAATAFAVYYPRQQFAHYGLLLVFPCSILLAMGIHCALSVHPAGRLALAGLFVFALLPPVAVGVAHGGVAGLQAHCLGTEENVFSRKMRDLTQPGDRLVVWGWRNSYFVETGLLQGSRWMYPQFATGSYSTKDENMRRYAEDLDTLRPKLILEWVGDDAFYFNGPRAVRMEEIPELGRRLAENYELVAVEGNQRLYLRKAASNRTTQ
jgi:hypothetical protein